MLSKVQGRSRSRVCMQSHGRDEQAARHFVLRLLVCNQSRTRNEGACPRMGSDTTNNKTMLGCKGLCAKLSLRPIPARLTKRDITRGLSACGHCQAVLSLEGQHCPCCNYKVRKRRLKNRSKDRVVLQAMMKIKHL